MTDYPPIMILPDGMVQERKDRGIITSIVTGEEQRMECEKGDVMMNIRLNQQDSAYLREQAPRGLMNLHEPWEFPLDKPHTQRDEGATPNQAELDGMPICPTCGRTLRGGHCPRCPSVSLAAPQKATDTQDRNAPIGIVQKGREDEEAADRDTSSGTPPELRKALARALKAELPPKAAPLIEYLVGNLDESGYLRCTVEETARILHASISQVEQVLAHLHAQEPAGIAARDVRECFLLQLQQLEARGQSQPYAAEIVSRFLPELAQQKYTFIAQQVGISRNQVEQVQRFLKKRLTPFPASRAGAHLRSFTNKK